MDKNELSDYLLYLMANDKLEQFYHSKAWKNLKLEVFKEQHFECQECLKENKLTVLSLKDHCHHIKELKDFPELALSKFFIDELGNEQRQLEAICFECHNKIHNRFQKKEKFFTEEKW